MVTLREPSAADQSPARHGAAEADATSTALGVISRARKFYYTCVESKAVRSNSEAEQASFRRVLEEMARRGVKLRAITEITKQNLEACRAMATVFELRHLDGVRGNFAVTDSEYIASSVVAEGASSQRAELIYSSNKDMVEHQEYVFETLWNSALPAQERISAIELGREAEVTEFLSERESAVRRVLQVLSNAKVKIDGIGNAHAPNLIVGYPAYWNTLLLVPERVPRRRYITDITEENVVACKKIISELGVELRHLQGVRSNLIASEGEFAADLSTPHPGSPTTRLLYSNVRELLAQQNELFETLWAKAVPADARINQIEAGIEPEETRLVNDMRETRELGRRMTEECRSEALIILASESTVQRNLALFEYLARQQAERGFEVRILAPFSPAAAPEAGALPGPTDLMRTLSELFGAAARDKVEFRRIEPINVSFFIYDRSKMFITQYANLSAANSERAIASNIYSTNRQTIAGIVSVFEALWRESELREREIAARLAEQRISREARLLQDILAHDIRNFNQVARLSAEMLKEELRGERPAVASMLNSLLGAIDGSTQLVERAKKLGLILSHPQAKLYPVDLLRALDESLSLVKSANSDRKILEETKKVDHEARVEALADDFLTEVFVNIFSNSVRYTDGDTVSLSIAIESEEQDPVDKKTPPAGRLSNVQRAADYGLCNGYWKVSIADEGRGIPDSIKRGMFTRYLESAKGSGLGMSIVYALVVERYGGRVRIDDKVPGDYPKGTLVEVWLRKAR